MLADLHCHTKLSDGSLGIDDLVILARKQGIDVISITDRNCQAGNVRGKLIGARHDVKVIPGVELSSFDTESQTEINILCYLAEFPDRLEGLCRRNMLASKKAIQFMILKTAQKYPITPDLVVKCASGSTTISVCHIMHALMEVGATNSVCGELYDELFNKENEDNIFVQAKYAEPAEVIDAIHEAGGVAVLANPSVYSDEIVEKMIALGIDGIEVWCSANNEEDIKKYLDLTKEHKLLSVGGSNFRGMYNRCSVTIGSFSTPKKQYDELMNYKAKQKRLQKKIENEEKVDVQ